MGYFRPVASFNIGKKGEYNERTPFTEKASQLPEISADVRGKTGVKSLIGEPVAADAGVATGDAAADAGVSTGDAAADAERVPVDAGALRRG